MTHDYKTSTVFSSLSGSHLYGTNTDTSDLDTRSVYIGPPLVCVRDKTTHWDEASDSLWVEIRTFLDRLVTGSNQEVEVLFSDKVLLSSKYFQPILDIRGVFLSNAWIVKCSKYMHKVLSDIARSASWVSNAKDVSHVLRLADTLVHYINTGTYNPVYAEFAGPIHMKYVRILKRGELSKLSSYDFSDIENHIENVMYMLDRHKLPEIDLGIVNAALYKSLSMYWSETYDKPSPE